MGYRRKKETRHGKNGKDENAGHAVFEYVSISAFTFGGGYVIVTLMKKRFVDELEYITEQEMLDMTALAQSCPGPLAVNAAILVGMKAAGTAGVCAAVLGMLVFGI